MLFFHKWVMSLPLGFNFFQIRGMQTKWRVFPQFPSKNIFNIYKYCIPHPSVTIVENWAFN